MIERLITIAEWAAILGLTALISITLAHAQSEPTVIVDCANESGRLAGCPICWGDADQSHDVTVDELVAVIARAVDGCPDRPDPFEPATVCWGDRNNDHEITKGELTAVVAEALDGCNPGAAR